MNIHALISARNKIIARMPSWARVIRGSLMRYRTKCGNKRCRCHTSKKYRHGPYTYLVVHKGNGKQRLYLIPPDKLDAVKKGKHAYNVLWNGLIKLAEINLLLLKSPGGGHERKPKPIKAAN